MGDIGFCADGAFFDFHKIANPTMGFEFNFPP
jgi:hypothetical protein